MEEHYFTCDCSDLGTPFASSSIPRMVICGSRFTSKDCGRLRELIHRKEAFHKVHLLNQEKSSTEELGNL